MELVDVEALHAVQVLEGELRCEQRWRGSSVTTHGPRNCERSWGSAMEHRSRPFSREWKDDFSPQRCTIESDPPPATTNMGHTQQSGCELFTSLELGSLIGNAEMEDEGEYFGRKTRDRSERVELGVDCVEGGR